MILNWPNYTSSLTSWTSPCFPTSKRSTRESHRRITSPRPSWRASCTNWVKRWTNWTWLKTVKNFPSNALWISKSRACAGNWSSRKCKCFNRAKSSDRGSQRLRTPRWRRKLTLTSMSQILLWREKIRWT